MKVRKRQLKREELLREREEAQRIQDEIMRGEKEWEVKERERKEFLKWGREIRLEEKRREKILAAGATRKREREEFLKWEREIQENELKIRTRPILVSSAIKNNTQKWVINGDDYVDPTIFLNSTSHKVIRLINSIGSVGEKGTYSTSMQNGLGRPGKTLSPLPISVAKHIV